MFWLDTYVDYNGITNDDFDETTIFYSFNTDRILNGDRVVRLLVQYNFSTQLEPEASVGPFVPQPFCVGVAYGPNPQSARSEGTSTKVIAMQSGDALYSAFLEWQPVRINNGTDDCRQWVASSRGVQSVAGTRRIEDKTEAGLYFGADCAESYVGTLTEVPLAVRGWMHVKILIKTLFE